MCYSFNLFFCTMEYVLVIFDFFFLLFSCVLFSCSLCLGHSEVVVKDFSC